MSPCSGAVPAVGAAGGDHHPPRSSSAVHGGALTRPCSQDVTAFGPGRTTGVLGRSCRNHHQLRISIPEQPGHSTVRRNDGTAACLRTCQQVRVRHVAVRPDQGDVAEPTGDPRQIIRPEAMPAEFGHCSENLDGDDGVVAVGTAARLLETLTHPDSVIGVVAQPPRWCRSNQARAASWCVWMGHARASGQNVVVDSPHPPTASPAGHREFSAPTAQRSRRWTTDLNSSAHNLTGCRINRRNPSVVTVHQILRVSRPPARTGAVRWRPSIMRPRCHPTRDRARPPRCDAPSCRPFPGMGRTKGPGCGCRWT